MMFLFSISNFFRRQLTGYLSYSAGHTVRSAFWRRIAGCEPAINIVSVCCR